MRFSRDGLRGLFRFAGGRSVEHRARLEPVVLAAFERRSGAQPARRWQRRLLGLGVGAAVALGACQLPASYELALGYRIDVEVDAETVREVDAQVIAAYIESNYAIEEMLVAVRMEADAGAPRADATAQMRFDMVGSGLEPEAMWSDIRDAFPALWDVEPRTEVLSSTMHGTWGGLVSRGYLDRIIDEHGVARAKARILEELARQGLTGEAEIEIRDEVAPDGALHRKVEVRVEAAADAASGSLR